MQSKIPILAHFKTIGSFGRLISLFFVIQVLLGGRVSAAIAKAECPHVVDTVSLVPVIGEQASQGTEVAFYEMSASVWLEPGQRVMLSSSPDGQGDISTDDLITLNVSPSGKHWEQDFRSSDRRVILDLPHQDISNLFTLGENQIAISLIDLAGPVYSSRPYYLVLIELCPTATPTVTNTATSTRTPSPTHTPSPTTTDTPTPIVLIETVLSVATVVVTATPTETVPPTATSLPTATPTPTVNVIDEEITPSTEANSPLLSFLLWLPVGLVVGMGGTLVWWRMNNSGPERADEVEVHSKRKFIKTYRLADFTSEVVPIGQDEAIALSELSQPGIVGRLRIPRRGTSGSDAVTLEILNPEVPDQVVESHTLLPNRSFTFEHYTLTYRRYDVSEDEKSDSQEEQINEY